MQLIDDVGNNLGIIPTEEAISVATEKQLDLVELVPHAKPPVCRIMDYGKFRFDRRKKAQQSKRKQKRTQVKEVKFRPVTEEMDYQTKLRNLIRFLSEGDKTKVVLRFRGREIAHRDLGMQILERIRDDLETKAVVEQAPQMEGRQAIMVLAPKKVAG